jgi:hypothetical protein
MSSPNDRVGEYSRVNDKENSFEHQADYFMPDVENAGQRTRQGKIWKGLKYLIWIGQALLLTTNIYGFTVTTRVINRESFSSKLNSLPRFRI